MKAIQSPDALFQKNNKKSIITIIAFGYFKCFNDLDVERLYIYFLESDWNRKIENPDNNAKRFFFLSRLPCNKRRFF